MKDSPTKGKRAKALLRRAFYSAGPSRRTKNLTQYFQLADRIAGRQRQPSGSNSNKPVKLLSFDAAVQFKSPDKNTSFLLSQLVASPSPAKFTPKKNTNTPNKLVCSPSHNTRSKLGTSPVVDLFKSPRSRCRVASSAAHLLQSPISRRNSPQVLAAEYGVKLGPVSTETTPEKSPFCGIVTLGLDSPSQNTRQRTSQTPTRKSVRAALFAKSPASNRNQSPYRGTASPRTLLDRFGSPAKQVPLKVFNVKSPMPKSSFNCKNHDTSSIVTHANNSLFKRISPQKKPLSMITALPSAHISWIDSCHSQLPSLSNKLSAEHKTLPGPKTPSPHGKKVTKTPDSFDKWHRRKPRLSQNSPCRNKNQTDYEIQVINQHTENDYVNVNQSKATSFVKNLNQSDDCANAMNVEIGSPKMKNRFKGILKKKRSLIQSPDQTVESPCKRRRMTGNDSVGAGSHGNNSTIFIMGSQGFDISGSCNELSQVSNASSVANDDVFMSQDTEVMDYENIETGSMSKKRLLHTFIERSSPRNKAVERLFSADIPNELHSDQSESPVFGGSNNRWTNRSRTVSGDVTSQSVVDNNQGNVLSGADSGRASPAHIVKSPTKKFSPNVSAKSLMHLIQSPLVLSPDSGGRKVNGNVSPRRSIVGDRSRRSLKMFN